MPTSGSSLARFFDLAFRDRTRRPAEAPPARLAAPLFTHHQIVELAAPFARRGLVLDLAASDRLQRRLIFRSVRHAPESVPAAGDVAEPHAAVLDTLQLESPSPGYFRLTRTLCEDGGLRATLLAEGERPGDLLARVEAVPPQRQFHVGPGYRLVSSGCATSSEEGDGGFRMTHAVVHTDTLRLSVNVSSSPSTMACSAAVEIEPRLAGDALPADLLAVLGWDWSMLQAGSQGWQGSMRLRGGPGSRGLDAEHKLHAAAAHLAQTLAEPPPRFHERLCGARWSVMLRQAIPLFAFALLVFCALFADVLRGARESPLVLGLVCIPVGLMLLFLLRSERPWLGLPMWPRPLSPHAWGTAR